MRDGGLNGMRIGGSHKTSDERRLARADTWVNHCLQQPRGSKHSYGPLSQERPVRIVAHGMTNTPNGVPYPYKEGLPWLSCNLAYDH